MRTHLVLGMTALLLGALAPIASAATEHPNGCPPDNTYSVSNAVGAFVPDAAKKVYGQSGVTLSINAAAGTTWTGTVGGSASGDIDAIIASAQATVSSSISWSKTTTVTLGGSWTVPSSQKTGWLALGSQGYSMHWQVAGYTGGCVYKVLRSGSAALPALTPMLAHS